MAMNEFKDLLSDLLKESGKSELSIETELGISRGFLGKLTRGKRSPTAVNTVLLADFFRLSGPIRDQFTLAASEARARRQSRAVPVINALNARLSESESEIPKLTSANQSAVAMASALINHFTNGRVKTDLQRLLEDGLVKGPKHMEAAVAKILARSGGRSAQ
jgi:transcriptional regulator with XRE-family HTH domain